MAEKIQLIDAGQNEIKPLAEDFRTFSVTALHYQQQKDKHYVHVEMEDTGKVAIGKIDLDVLEKFFRNIDENVKKQLDLL